MVTQIAYKQIVLMGNIGEETNQLIHNRYYMIYYTYRVYEKEAEIFVVTYINAMNNCMRRIHKSFIIMKKIEWLLHT